MVKNHQYQMMHPAFTTGWKFHVVQQRGHILLFNEHGQPPADLWGGNLEQGIVGDMLFFQQETEIRTEAG